jgi:hypothetical protein
LRRLRLHCGICRKEAQKPKRERVLAIGAYDLPAIRDVFVSATGSVLNLILSAEHHSVRTDQVVRAGIPDRAAIKHCDVKRHPAEARRLEEIIDSWCIFSGITARPLGRVSQNRSGGILPLSAVSDGWKPPIQAKAATVIRNAL